MVKIDPERAAAQNEESSKLMINLKEKLQFRVSVNPRDKRIISKTMYPVETQEHPIQLEEIREVMTVDYFDFDHEDFDEICNRNTWREKPTIDTSTKRLSGTPCLVYRDDINPNILEKDRILSLYAIFPGEDEKSVRLDRVFMSTQRKYKDQIIVDHRWGLVKDTNMPQESLKATVDILHSLGYTNIELPEQGQELKPTHAISVSELQQALDTNNPAQETETKTVAVAEAATNVQPAKDDDLNLLQEDNLEELWLKDIAQMDLLAERASDQVYTMQNIIDNDFSKEPIQNRLNFILRMASQIERSQSLLDQVFSGTAVERLKATINPTMEKLKKYVARVGHSEAVASELPLLISHLENINLEKQDNGLSVLLPIVMKIFYETDPDDEMRIFYRRDGTAKPYLESSLQLLSLLESTLKKSNGVDQTPATAKIRSTIMSSLRIEFAGHNTLANDVSTQSSLDSDHTADEERYIRWRQDILVGCLDQLNPQEAIKLYKATLKNAFEININNPLYGSALTEAALNHILDEKNPGSSLLEVKKDIITQVLNGRYSSSIYQALSENSEIGSNRKILQKIARSLETSLAEGAKSETIDILPNILMNISKVRSLVFHGGILEAREDPIRDVLREFLIFTDFSQFDPNQYNKAEFEKLKTLKTDFMADILKIDKRFPITEHNDSAFGYSDHWYNKALEAIRRYNSENAAIYKKVLA